MAATAQSSTEQPLLDTPYEFPIRPGTPEWIAAAEEGRHMVLCNVPTNIVSRLTTRALAQTCITYPFRGNVTAFQSPDLAISSMRKSFNGLNELCSRADSGKELLKLYLAEVQRFLKLPTTEEALVPTMIDSAFFSAILSYEPVVTTLDNSEITELVRANLRHLVWVRTAVSFPSGAEAQVAELAMALFVDHSVELKENGANVSKSAFRSSDIEYWRTSKKVSVPALERLIVIANGLN